MENKRILGHHGIWEVSGANPELLKESVTIVPLLDKITQTSGLTVLGREVKQFEPYGVTMVYLLSESHLSIHTWPEHSYAALDLFSCKVFDPEQINAIIQNHLMAELVDFKLIERGIPRMAAL